MDRKSLKLLGVFPAVLTAGCLYTEPGYEQAAILASESLPDFTNEWEELQEQVDGEPIGWIEALEDPVLLAFVEEAESNNFDLRATLATVERFRAAVGLDEAALYPAIDGNADFSSNGAINQQRDIQTIGGGISAAWEIDLWGRLLSAKQSAIADFESAAADYRFSRYVLAATVATAYFDAVAAALQEDVARGTYDALRETTRVVELRFENGAANAEDVALTRTDLATQLDALLEAEGSKRDAYRTLAVLVGRYPTSQMDIRNTQPSVPTPPPAGLPAQLLERRPDIIASKLAISSAVDNLDSSRAAKFPALTISGSFDAQEPTGSGVFAGFNDGSWIWNFVGGFTQPIFDAGALDAQEEIAIADLDSAVATYGAVVLDAFNDVELALDQTRVLRHRQDALADAAAEAQRALDVSKLRYREGETDILDVLEIEQRLFNAQSNLVLIERDQLANYISLALALGGDWRAVKAELDEASAPDQG
ncbi:MAG: TolC family protein [Pseudomonadota bacterium]